MGSDEQDKKKVQDLGLQKKRRIAGSAEGLFVVPDDFDDPLPPKIQRYFEGEVDEDEDLNGG